MPLAYPALLYLLARMLWIGFRRRPGAGLRPSCRSSSLAVMTVLLSPSGWRLNVADSNVIDVGYSGVIGADRIADGETLYGNFPDDNHSGDTYGPIAYYAYVPFEQVFPGAAAGTTCPPPTPPRSSSTWPRWRPCSCSAAACAAGAGGTRLGILLAFAWAAYPYTAFALESNTNDSLVAPPGRRPCSA